MTTTRTQKYIDTHSDDISAMIRSTEVQAHINALYNALNNEIVAAFPELADKGGKIDTHESTRIELKAMILKQYFTNWVK